MSNEVRMFRNYLLIALRRFRRHPGYTFINVFGLAVGLAACILIGLYGQDELSYDAFHENKDRTYRVIRAFDVPTLDANDDAFAATPTALAPVLKENIPAVEAAVRVNANSPVVKRDSEAFVETGFIWVDDGFFDIFSFPFVRGESTLDRPGTMALSESMAAKYFPGEDPIGKTLQVGSEDMGITGVLADVPANSHLQFNFVGSFDDWPFELGWSPNNYTTYVLLANGYSRDEVLPQVAELLKASVPNPRGGNPFVPYLQPITGIHLQQGVPVDITFDFQSRGDIGTVYLFIALAGFILLLACVNFINLSTARSAERAREVGMRKTLGARRGQVAAQFFGETLVMSVLAVGVALLLCTIGLPLFNDLSGKSLSLSAIFSGPRVVWLGALVVVTGLVSGSYPALVLGGFQATDVLKGVRQGRRDTWLRKSLVIFQFGVSVVLIICTVGVLNQLQYMRSSGLGFDENGVIVVHKVEYLNEQAYLKEQRNTFEQELRRLAGVEQVTAGWAVPGTFFTSGGFDPDDPDIEVALLRYAPTDFDYVETLGLDIIAGRSLSREFATDSFAVMLNESAVAKFGWSSEEAIGKRMMVDPGYRATVIGVVRDFHFESLHEEIQPLALLGPMWSPRYIAARIVTGNTAETLIALERVWKKFSDLSFEYSFLADDLAAQYKAEERLATVFAVFAGLAILIACLGLFGLAAYAAETRTKEIGIRKVLGASVPAIVTLLSKDFLKLVFVAFVIAAPVAYLAMRRWLENFAYHIDLGMGVFLLAGILAVVIALLTVSYQAVRAALADPVKSLRYE